VTWLRCHRPGRLARRVLLGLALLQALLAPPARALEPQLPAAPDSAAGRALLAQTLGADAAGGWAWLRAWRQVFPDDLAAYQQLRRGVVERYLLQAAGEPLAPDTPLAELRAWGATLPPLDVDRDAQARWARALERGLVPLRATEGPLPDEIEALAARLEPLAPGLWLLRQADGRARNLFWAQRVSVRGPVSLAPRALEARVGEARGGEARAGEARVGPAGAGGLVFDCPPQRGQPRSVRPGDTWLLLCRSRGEPDLRSPALRALAVALSRDGVAQPVWASGDLLRQGLLEEMIDALTALAPDPTAAYAQAHQPCELRARCHLEAHAMPAPRGHSAGRAPARASAPKPLHDAAPTPRQLARAGAAAVAAFIVFCFVARLAGARVAALLVFVPLAVLAWRYGSGYGAASVLLAGGALVAALLATGVFVVAYWLYDATVFTRFAPRAAGHRPRRRASA
jgi:hypothetical protein